MSESSESALIRRSEAIDGQRMSAVDLVANMGEAERKVLLSHLSEDEQTELVTLLARDRRMWKPNAGPQSVAYYCPARKLFYGGSAGGGKTDLLVGLAGTQHTKSIVFRREFPQMQDVVLRIEEIFGKRARTFKTSSVYKITDGAVTRILELGSVQYEKSVSKYRGRPHSLKAFDEVTEFSEFQFRFLTGWTRSVVIGERLRIIAAGNPPSTSEGEWVISYWSPWIDDKHPNPAAPGEIRWYAILDGKDVEVDGPDKFIYRNEVIEPESRTFIPAGLADNPYLRNSGYRGVLQNLPEPYRSQLLYGDFKAGRQDDDWQVIPSRWYELAVERWKQRVRDEGFAKLRGETELSSVGVDVARGGKDKTVISRRHGLWFDELISYPGSDTPTGPIVAQHVVRSIQGRKGLPQINIDIIGVGGSVYDSLVGMNIGGRLGEIRAVNVGEASDHCDLSGKLRCHNLRAETVWRLREALDPDNGVEICLPPDPELKADLCAAKWRPIGNRIVIEDKSEVKKRYGRSPDKGDAVALCWLYDERPEAYGQTTPMDPYETLGLKLPHRRSE